jgi:hypothetical protein
MTIIAETHVHLYPGYDVPRALRTLRANLMALEPGAIPVGFLTEAAGHNAFVSLCGGALSSDGALRVTVREEETAAGGALRCLEVRGDDRGSSTSTSRSTKGDVHPPPSVRPSPLDPLILFPGRQVVARERVEILALTLEEAVADGRTAVDTVAEILDLGGVPVVGWAPGKWFFERGEVVRGLLDRFAPGDLLIGDTSLRPLGWGEPRLMRAGRERGFGVVAGSDPLPAAGEEAWLGRYAARLEGEWDAGRPVASARRLLRAGAGAAARRGRRGGIAIAAWRIGRHMARGFRKAGTTAR